ncbi:hypothetical protein VT50_0201110 [Streptomyces antioxidans]|uniref:Uncharacterized protein n=1 Tax=Streptomyces antioxidans TaxID=1507734 RepID=A0A1V4DDK0_9ACTN|nr:hypothetical protein VT50_0201110 [Streptomyces antioxidans]
MARGGDETGVGAARPDKVACVTAPPRVVPGRVPSSHPAEWDVRGAPEGRMGADVDAAPWSAPSAVPRPAVRLAHQVRRLRRRGRENRSCECDAKPYPRPPVRRGG